MNRIIQGLALAAIASAVHAAPGDAYPSGGAPLFITAQQTHASMNVREGMQSVSAFPSGGAPLFVTAKQTHADLHANDAKTQRVEAFPGAAPGAGD